MFTIFKNTHYDFQGKRRVAFFISVSLIIIGLVATVLRGGPNYSIDFTGGLSIVLRFEQHVEESDVRATMGELGFPMQR